MTSLQTPDFSPGEFGCLAHRPIFIASLNSYAASIIGTVDAVIR